MFSREKLSWYRPIKLFRKSRKPFFKSQLVEKYRTLPFERVFEADSFKDLKAALRQQWGKKTLRGGPEKWVKRLMAIGTRGFKDDCTFRMQHLWDARNLIVHARGIADRIYPKKYAKLKLKPGERVRVAATLFRWWLDGLKDFIEPTDQFFSRYGSGLLRTYQRQLEIRGLLHTSL